MPGCFGKDLSGPNQRMLVQNNFTVRKTYKRGSPEYMKASKLNPGYQHGPVEIIRIEKTSN